ncbi:MAG: NAD-binding protein [Poseidonia sp.]|jgi:trk system potassium uptake protein TrkA
MRVIIGGAGRVGISLAKALANEKYDLVVVDNDSRAVSNAQALDCLVIHGSITSRDTLLEAGILTAQVFVAATPSDEANLIACAIAEHAHRDLKGKDKLTSICRLRDPTYIDEFRNGHLGEWANVNHVVNPLRGAIRRLNAGLRSTEIEEVIAFEHGAFVLEFDIGSTASSIVNRPLKDVKEDFVHGIPNIVGVKRDGQRSFIPNDESVLEIGDRIAVAVVGLDKFNPALITFGHEVSYFPEHPRVVIVGATSNGTKMAQDWLEHGATVTVLERNLHLANQLAGSKTGGHPNLDVIHGDHLDRSILEEISIDQFDVAVSALDDDHANIAAVLLMSDLGVPHTGLMLNDADLVKVTQRMGISFAVDRHRVAVSNMLTHIHQSLSGHYALLTEIPNVVGITLAITEKAKFAGKTVAEAQFPDWLRPAFIKRMNLSGSWESIEPKADELLLENDRMVVFCLKERVAEAQKRFKV